MATFPLAGTFGSVSMVEDSSGEPPPESPEFEDVALALESADKERVLDNFSDSPDWEKSFDWSGKHFRTWNDLASLHI